MIYVIGMSHAINVLKAASLGEFGLTHENWSGLDSGERFFPLATKPGILPGDHLQAFIITRTMNWGSVAELRTAADGARQALAVEGYVRLLDTLADTGTQDVLFSFLHGNEHSILSLVQHPRPYDFHLPFEAESRLVPQAQPIAFELIQRQMERALNPVIGSLAMMRNKLPHLRIVHVMPPPPIESEAHIRNAPEVFRERIEQDGVTPLSIRVKYYRLAEHVLEQALQPYRITLLRCPPEAAAPGGAIRDDYAFGATHGNEAYGALVLQQMRALAS